MSQVPSAARHALQVPHAWLSSFFSGEIPALLLVRRRVEPDLEWQDGNGNDLAQVVTPALQGPTRVLPTPPNPPITWPRSTGNRIS